MPDILIRGLASVFGSVDLGGDVIHRGAFAESILKTPSVPIFWEHEHGFFASETLPIGRTTQLEETEAGLFFAGPPAPTNRGKDVATLLANDVVSQASIGFNIARDENGQIVDGAIEFDDQGIRHMFKLDLLEVSVVTWGMNPKTLSELVITPTASEVFAAAFQRLVSQFTP